MSFASSRVFKATMALLSPAKSSTPATSAVVATLKAKAKAKTPSTSTKITGIMKMSPISPALRDFLGTPEASRSEAVKKIWSYIKLNNLQSPADKRVIVCDDKLKTIFDGKDRVGFLEVAKLLSPHFVKAG